MAVSLVGSWSSAVDGADPSGTVTVGSGTNRVLIYVVGAVITGYSISSMTVGGVSADWKLSYIETSGSAFGLNDQRLWAYVWGEDTLAAMSSTTVAYDDGVAPPAKLTSMYATYASVEQVSPPTATAWDNDTDVLSVDTTSDSGDRIIVALTRHNATATFR